jgi:hypothetical protein
MFGTSGLNSTSSSPGPKTGRLSVVKMALRLQPLMSRHMTSSSSSPKGSSAPWPWTQAFGMRTSLHEELRDARGELR